MRLMFRDEMMNSKKLSKWLVRIWRDYFSRIFRPSPAPGMSEALSNP